MLVDRSIIEIIQKMPFSNDLQTFFKTFVNEVADYQTIAVYINFSQPYQCLLCLRIRFICCPVAWHGHSYNDSLLLVRRSWHHSKELFFLLKFDVLS